MEDSRGDAELLRALRDGDKDAYAVLWERHIGAALRYAHRLFPSRAEDLASEALLAVYQQVTSTSAGPEFAFRPYLKAVIRNTAIRWRKDADHIDDTVEPDPADFRDAPSLVERKLESADILAAFQELPERWQRVLWMAEVADASRSDIARDLSIKPNAVSALQRRARTGLKLQWLSRQIPVALREDTAHVARLFPQYLTEQQNAALIVEVGAHTSVCVDCRVLLGSLRGGAARLQGTTLAVLLGSAGLGLPSTASMISGTAIAAAATGVGLSGWLLGGGVLVAGSLWLSSVVIAPPAHTEPEPPTSAQWSATDVPADLVSPIPPLPVTGKFPSVTPLPVDSAALGRWVTDPTIPLMELRNDLVMPPLPTKPQPAGPGVPGPGPDDGGTPTLSPGVTSSTNVTAYIAPMITGQTTPGSGVAIDFASERYVIDVAADGSWSFDPRPLAFDEVSYDYAVWAFTPTEQSLATTGTIILQTPTVQGFEQISGPIPLDEARATGIVVSITGPPNGTVWVSTPKTDATITLDGTGHAIRRIRMLADGWYPFGVSVADAEGYFSPGFAAYVDVIDPSRGPDWPRGSGGIFEIVDP